MGIRYWQGIGLCGLVLLCSVGAAQGAPAHKWGAHLDNEGRFGNKRNIGESDLFLPLAQDSRTLLFADLRGRFDDHASREGNFGLGVRRMLDSGWNLGAYGYYDRRRSPYKHYFDEVTLGAEALGRDWDLRVNGYIPTGRRSYDVNSLNTATLSGTSVTLTGGAEKSLAGYDGEIGWRVPLFDAGGGRQLRLCLGGYRFTASNTPTISGPRARIEFTIDQVPHLWRGARLALGAEVQHDGPRGTQGFVGLSLRIPLGATARDENGLDWQERRMTAPVVRDVDVVTEAGAYGPRETATQTSAGTSFSVISSSSTSGANLPTAVASANSTVILSGTFNTTADTVMQNGQTLIGGGALTVKAPSGRTATLTIPGATINGTSTNAVVMNNNSTLENMTVNDTVAGINTAVQVIGVSNVFVLNNTLTSHNTTTASVTYGITLYNVNTITISGNTLNGIGAATAEGLGVDTSSSVIVSGNTLSATGGASANYAIMATNSSLISAASTGNIFTAGTCRNGGLDTGTIYYNGGQCP